MAQEHGLIRDWHAHVYFDAAEAEAARALCEAMRDRFGIPMGWVHTAPVGPHPRGSCQMTVPPQMLAGAMEWLVLNRGPFTVFLHANTGNGWSDHTAHVVWLGKSEPLNLSIFS